MSGRSVNLTTLFLGRVRPPKWLTSTSCTYFRKEKRKYVARPGIEPRTCDLRYRCPTDWATWPGKMRVNPLIWYYSFQQMADIFHSHKISLSVNETSVKVTQSTPSELKVSKRLKSMLGFQVKG